jgi:hypothetical protein
VQGRYLKRVAERGMTASRLALPAATQVTHGNDLVALRLMVQ